MNLLTRELSDRLSVASVFVLVLAFGSAALAQSSSTGATGTSDQVPEIVVTAQKREENLQRVPAAVSVLDARALQDMGIQNVSDVALKIPSLQVSQNAPTHTSYKIRGLGNEGDVLTFEPEVALFFDGAYRLKAVFGANELMDVERIEVLKGPQSTLYGKNATAGVVNVVTESPSSDFHGGFDVDADQYRILTRGFINGGLTDHLDARLSYFYDDGTRAMQENTGTAPPGEFTGHQWGVRPQLLLTPTDQLSIRLIAGYVWRHPRPIDPTFRYSAVDATVINAVSQALGVPPLDAATLQPNADRHDTTQWCNLCAWRSEVETSEATAITEYDFGAAKLTAISSYDHYIGSVSQNAGETLDIISYVDKDYSRSYSQELRLASKTNGPLQWIVGGYYYRNVVGDAVYFTNGTAVGVYGLTAFGTTGVYGLPGDHVADDSQNSDRLFSLYANGSWQVTDQATLKAGVRYSTENKVGDTHHTLSVSPDDVGTSLVEFLTTAEFIRKDSYVHTTGNVGFDYQLTPDSLAYLNLSTAYKAGGFNVGFGAQATQPSYLPEKVTSYEIGLKNTLFDRRLQVNADAFLAMIDDYQAASFQGLSYGVSNAESATTRGLEGDLIAKLGGGIEFDLNYAFTDAYYRRFTSGPCFSGNTNVTTGGNCNLSGYQLPYSAKNKIGLGLSYERSDGYYARADEFITSAYNANTSLDPHSVQDRFALTNIRIGWRNQRYNVALYTNNVFNKVYLIQEAAAPVSLGNSLDAWLGGHREVGGKFSVSF